MAVTLIWLHFSAVASTYLAAGLVGAVVAGGEQKEEGWCPTAGSNNLNANCSSAWQACLALERGVTPIHVILPIAVCNVVTLITHVPSLLLHSRVRAAHMQACCSRVCLLLLQIVVTYIAFSRVSHMLSYALSLHFALFFLSLVHTQRAPLIGDEAARVLRCLSVLGLLLACWRFGPALPVVDVLGLPGGCGAQAHLLGFFYAGALCPIVLSGAERLLRAVE